MVSKSPPEKCIYRKFAKCKPINCNYPGSDFCGFRKITKELKK